MCSPHATGVVEMRERAFDPLAALPHQLAPAWTAHASTIAIDGPLRVRRFGPVASPSVPLGDVGPDAHGLEVHHRLIAGRVEEKRGGVQDPAAPEASGVFRGRFRREVHRFVSSPCSSNRT